MLVSVGTGSGGFYYLMTSEKVYGDILLFIQKVFSREARRKDEFSRFE
jgi:hypothetical protein